MEFNEETVLDLLRMHQKAPTWIDEARKTHKDLKALVLGEDFNEVLIEKIEHIESKDRQVARKKYSKDIRDLFERVLSVRSNVFSASGGSKVEDIASEEKKEQIIKALSNFKGQKSLSKYLSETLFTLLDTDPNGCMVLNYKGDEKIYPVYKSINDIRYYKSEGQLVKFIIFEPKQVKDGNRIYHIWRVIDDKKDWYIKQEGETYTVIEDESFEHPFGQPPVILFGETNKMGSEIRIPSIEPVIELAKDYARDKSIKTIYKFQHGFPRHWRYVEKCRKCQGTGKTGEDGACKTCSGKGYMGSNDVTDVVTLNLPRDKDDALVAPNVEGFVAPDLATWERMTEELKLMESLVEDTLFGTSRVREGGNETATGRFIDVQPVINKLNDYTDYAEWFHNQILKFVLRWAYNNPEPNAKLYKSYGRRFIIEGADTILDKYNDARQSGSNNTILDKLLDEFILAKYSNNPVLLDEMMKKREVEPYIHQSIEQVNNIFGAKEANKKVVFEEFWEEVDKQKTIEQLKVDFLKYFEEKTAPEGLSEIEKAAKALSLQSPLVATKLLEDLTREERRLLLSITTPFKEEIINTNNNEQANGNSEQVQAD